MSTTASGTEPEDGTSLAFVRNPNNGEVVEMMLKDITPNNLMALFRLPEAQCCLYQRVHEGDRVRHIARIQRKDVEASFEHLEAGATYIFPEQQETIFYPPVEAYNDVHERPKFILKNGIVVGAGLVKKVEKNQVICTLPENMRPEGRNLFNSNHGPSHHRIDVMPDGRVLVVEKGSHSNPYASLAQIVFVPANNST